MKKQAHRDAVELYVEAACAKLEFDKVIRDLAKEYKKQHKKVEFIQSKLITRCPNPNKHYDIYTILYFVWLMIVIFCS